MLERNIEDAECRTKASSETDTHWYLIRYAEMNDQSSRNPLNSLPPQDDLYKTRSHFQSLSS